MFRLNHGRLICTRLQGPPNRLRVSSLSVQNTFDVSHDEIACQSNADRRRLSDISYKNSKRCEPAVLSNCERTDEGYLVNKNPRTVCGDEHILSNVSRLLGGACDPSGSFHVPLP